jgi:hypothetical protein
MAKGPICIITSGGMVCMSSPLKTHKPYGRTCKEEPRSATRDRARQQELAALRTTILSNMPPVRGQSTAARKAEATVIARVACLMRWSHAVRAGEGFTIIKK